MTETTASAATTTTDAVLQLEQKARRTKIKYRFFDDYVEYNIRDSRGDTATFNARYEDLPGKFDYRTLQLRRTKMLVPTLLVMLITIGALMQDAAHAPVTLAFSIAYGGFLLGLSYWLQQRNQRVYTTLPTKGGKLLVLRDRKHEEIIGELANRRRAALRRLAIIDPANPPQADFKKFIWLKEEGAISEEELETYRDRLGVAAPAGGYKTRVENETPLLVKSQKAFRLKNEFGFFDRHLSFLQDDGAVSAFNLWYGDLPHPSEYRRFSKKESYGMLVFAAGMIVAIAFLNRHAADSYYVGNEGLMRLLEAAAFFLPLLAGAIWLAQRHTRKEFTIIPVQKGALRILNDAQHDDILEEIQRRRLGALREHAVLNQHNSPQAELKKFAWLKEQGAISGTEFETFRRRIIDDHEPPPAAPVSKPPRETLH